MLFMSIFTYDPDKRDEVIKRGVGKEQLTGGKIIGQWAAIGGGRIFRVVEADDPKAMLATAMTWTDLGNDEIIPIMTVEDMMKLVARKK